MNNISVRWKLILSNTSLYLTTLVVAVVGILGISSINQSMDNLYHQRMQSASLVKSVDSTIYDVRGSIYRYFVVTDQRGVIRKDIDQKLADADAKMAEFAKTATTPDEVSQLEKYNSAMKEFRASIGDFYIQADTNEQNAIIASLNTGGRILNARIAVSTPLEELVKIEDNLAQKSMDEANSLTSNIRTILIVVTLIMGIFALIVGFVIVRSIAVPLAVVSSMLQNIAVGNLNRDISTEAKKKLLNRNDEIGLVGKALSEMEHYLQDMARVASEIALGHLNIVVIPKSDKDELGQAFTLMVRKLHQQVTLLTDNATRLSEASLELTQIASQAGQATAQIAATMGQVARGAEQQADALSQTAKSADQMSQAIDGVAKGAQHQSNAVSTASGIALQITQAIQQIAENAQASTLKAQGAAISADTGVTTVNGTIAEMQSIKEKVGISAEKVQEMGRRSDQIGTIVETIDDIASQTNLLALNAAIEAARAGEHGKGFAVVADEVRKLAERSSNATKEIGELVKGIQKVVAQAVAAMKQSSEEVDRGIIQADKCQDALKSILDAAQVASVQIATIARSSTDISHLADELVGAIDTVSAVVEENTATTEQMSANSNEVQLAMETIASVGQENSASVEEVSASTEELSAQVDEVTASANSLAQIATTLKQVVAQFAI